jgi:hypothetical protein
MANDEITTTLEFKTSLDTLILDLAHAGDHYALFRKLLAAKEGTYTKALSQSQTFWSLTYGAHFDAAVFRLCRAYDQGKGALTLKTLLEIIKARPAFLPPPALLNVLDEKQLDEDLAWVDLRKNKVVKHLMIWRHKFYAHRDLAKTLTGRLAEEYPVTDDEVAKLLENGFNMLNRYNAVFFGAHFAREVHGLDDYEKVLKILQERVELWEAQLQAEVQRARREAGEE